MTVRVGDQEKIDGKVLTKLETFAGDEIVETELIDVTDRGVLCYARTWSKDKSRQFDPPQTLVPEPLKIGVTWELNDIIAGSDMHQKWSVAAEEEVEVPAGKFKAYRLHSEQPWPLSIMIDRWFVRGTGIVKDITTTRGPTGRLLSRVTMTLRKFAVVPVSNTNRSSTLPAPPSLTFSPDSGRDAAIKSFRNAIADSAIDRPRHAALLRNDPAARNTRSLRNERWRRHHRIPFRYPKYFCAMGWQEPAGELGDSCRLDRGRRGRRCSAELHRRPN